MYIFGNFQEVTNSASKRGTICGRQSLPFDWQIEKKPPFTRGLAPETATSPRMTKGKGIGRGNSPGNTTMLQPMTIMLGENLL
ncbi:hypothetical protein SAMN06265218_104215 [Fodinibius sediminis]|uniref:Uncharacterized protein n=1 Tax=Fodinibius sediminis TaxID=1214077 RepID=A0A521BZS2_9BACT|nr:hypothetical protein SAMN06265218_104215 [Fodinibius sediminis]